METITLTDTERKQVEAIFDRIDTPRISNADNVNEAMYICETAYAPKLLRYAPQMIQRLCASYSDGATKEFCIALGEMMESIYELGVYHETFVQIDTFFQALANAQYEAMKTDSVNK